MAGVGQLPELHLRLVLILRGFRLVNGGSISVSVSVSTATRGGQPVASFVFFFLKLLLLPPAFIHVQRPQFGFKNTLHASRGAHERHEAELDRVGLLRKEVLAGEPARIQNEALSHPTGPVVHRGPFRTVEFQQVEGPPISRPTAKFATDRLRGCSRCSRERSRRRRSSRPHPTTYTAAGRPQDKGDKVMVEVRAI